MNLPATAKVLLVDTLCTNLLLLNPSIHSLVTSTKDSTEDGGAEGYASLLQSHRNALKIYVLFLHEICAAEEKEAPAAAAEKAAAAPAGGRVSAFLRWLCFLFQFSLSYNHAGSKLGEVRKPGLTFSACLVWLGRVLSCISGSKGFVCQRTLLWSKAPQLSCIQKRLRHNESDMKVQIGLLRMCNPCGTWDYYKRSLKTMDWHFFLGPFQYSQGINETRDKARRPQKPQKGGVASLHLPQALVLTEKFSKFEKNVSVFLFTF